MKKHQRMIILLCAVLFWTGIAAIIVSGFFTGMDMHNTFLTYVHNEMADKYNINQANLEMLQCEQDADTVSCLYKVTDESESESYITVVFLRHTLRSDYKISKMQVLSAYPDDPIFKRFKNTAG